jgi:hypothetical protein
VAFPRFDALPVVVAGCIAIALLMVPAVVERAEVRRLRGMQRRRLQLLHQCDPPIIRIWTVR